MENVTFHRLLCLGRVVAHRHHIVCVERTSKLETLQAAHICNGLRQIIFSDCGHFSKMTPTYVKETAKMSGCQDVEVHAVEEEYSFLKSAKCIVLLSPVCLRSY